MEFLNYVNSEMDELIKFKPQNVSIDPKYQFKVIIDFGGVSKLCRSIIAGYLRPSTELYNSLKLENYEWIDFWYNPNNSGIKQDLLDGIFENGGTGLSNLSGCIDAVLFNMTLARVDNDLIRHSAIKSFMPNQNMNKRLLPAGDYVQTLLMILWRLEPFSFGVDEIAALFQHPIFPDVLKEPPVPFECFSEGFKKIETLIKSQNCDELFLEYLFRSVQKHCLENIQHLKFSNVIGNLSPVSTQMVTTAFGNVANLKENFRPVVDSIGVSLFQQQTHPNYFWFLSGIGYSDPGADPLMMVNHFKVNALILKLSIASQNFIYGVYVLIRLRIFVLSQQKSLKIFCFDDYVEFITAFSDFVNYCSKNSNTLVIISDWYTTSMIKMVNMRDYDVVLGIRRQKYVFSDINDIFQQTKTLGNFEFDGDFFNKTNIPIFTPNHYHYKFFFDEFDVFPVDICKNALFNPVEFLCVMNEMLRETEQIGVKRNHKVKISSFFKTIDYEYTKNSYCSASNGVEKKPEENQIGVDMTFFFRFLKTTCNIPNSLIDEDENFEYATTWNALFDDQDGFDDLLFQLSKYDKRFNGETSGNKFTNVLCVGGKCLEFKTIAKSDSKHVVIDYSSSDDFTGIFNNLLPQTERKIIFNLENEFWEFVQIYRQNPDKFAELLLLLKQSDIKTFQRIICQFCIEKITVLCMAQVPKLNPFEILIKKQIDHCAILTVSRSGDGFRNFYFCQNTLNGELTFVYDKEYNF